VEAIRAYTHESPIYRELNGRLKSISALPALGRADIEKAQQEALRELCRRVDAVIVAGGRESANTRRLLAAAEAAGKKAWLVESAAALPRETAAFRVIGLSAGASTPDETVDEIERALAN
jgi:4-hydroxy-3-methylbut-2-enyl diphosphate reductase